MVFENVGKLFGLLPEKKQSAKSTGSKKKLQVLNPYSNAEKKLERIILQSKLINSGRVHLLGLDKIREGLGDRWPDLRERILDNLNRIIESRIGGNDVYFSRSDEEHFIVFANTSDNEARLVCAKILQELMEIYLGSTDTRDIIVKTAVGRIDDKMIFESASLENIFEQISFVNVEDTPQENNRPTGPNNSPGSQNAEMEAPYEVIYRPVWDVRNEAISTYMVNSRSLAPFKRARLGYDVLIDPCCVEAMIGLDNMILMETINTMDDLFRNNFRAIFSIPVCYETLFNSERLRGFLSRCQVIPPELHKYIAFCLVNFPPGVPETKLGLIVSSLKSYSRAVAMACDNIPQDLNYYKECGIRGFHFVLPGRSPDPAKYWRQMAAAVAKCKQSHMYTSLTEINHQEDLILARETGVNFLSGSIIGEYTDIPGHMARVSWKELIGK